MKDDAVYTEHPGGAEIAYIPYWRHCQLRYKDQETIKRLFWMIGVLCAVIIALLVAIIGG